MSEESDRKILDKLDAADKQTLDVFNEFVQSNMVRNNFLPVMEHLCKVAPKQFDMNEYADKKTEETTCVRFHIDCPNDENGIDGRVGYDTFDYPDKKIMSYELWWGGECYCHLDRPVEIINMISILLGVVKLENRSDAYKLVRKTDHVFPLEAEK